ncbi:MAG: DUF533 domain-containing protein, partial [Planctomycetota bacterium]
MLNVAKGRSSRSTGASDRGIPTPRKRPGGDPPDDNEEALVLVRAMISAAKADGHIDASEQARIEQQIDSLNIGAEEQQFLVEQLRASSDPVAIARLSNGEEQAAEIYLASLLALDLDTPEER